MKIYFLGTCAGTEPMPDRKHMSFVIESNHKLYWFDAGEGCSYTGYLLGLDLLAVKNIMISHTHMDHVGGLANLLWNIRKVIRVKGEPCRYGDIDLYIPNIETWNGVLTLLENSDGGNGVEYTVHAHEVKSGLLFDDGTMRVTAYHNTHVSPERSGAKWSYSYEICCEGKTIVYSGDVGDYHELDGMLQNGCDALIIETGHYGIDAVYDYTKDRDIQKIFFSHNGREILNNPAQAQEKIRSYFKGQAVICEDGMVVEL